MTEEFDTDYTDEIICPYCGHEHEAYSISLDEDEGEHFCEKCKTKFGWEAEREVYYSTRKLSCLTTACINMSKHKYSYMVKNILGDAFYKCCVCGATKIGANPL